jgi:secondary thiamine-phosphate synthase enzyme
MMKEITVHTSTQKTFVDITPEVGRIIADSGIKEGVCFICCPHTTAGLTLNENWDPDVQADMEDALDLMVPEKCAYRHSEGNSPAHIKSSMLGASQIIFVHDGCAVLGRWQGIYLAEFDGPRVRRVLINILPAA